MSWFQKRIPPQISAQFNKLIRNYATQQKFSGRYSFSEPPALDYFDEWAFLTWALLTIINRLQRNVDDACNFLDYGGKHFQEKIHAALVDLVNKAQRMQSPMGVPATESSFERFYQAYVSSLISLHELYTMSQQKWLSPEFEAQIHLFKEQLIVCFQYQRDFCNGHRFFVWQQLRLSQVQKMTKYGYNNKGFLSVAMSFYTHMLYNLGVLAARLQVTMGMCFETQNTNGFTKSELIQPLLLMVYTMVDMLISDSIICIEPSQNPILVTNNLFPTKVVSLSQCTLFKRFQLQIVSEEVAHQIQQEIRHRRMFEPMIQIRPTPSAALLAIKPSTGVKRNNATASSEGGNTAHKKSDVNSKEWISIPPSYDPATQSWTGTYPHLLCTTRQKDTLLDTRSSAQTGKRPLFYFHVKAEVFGFNGDFQTVHTLSMPFAIATRRNQDCQVQRMMSSYTATCFWLYGTATYDGLLLQWYDNGIEWKHFKELYAQYFAMNAEVNRSLCEEDFNMLEQKMHCPECEESQYHIHLTTSQQQPLPLITFKNVLCPHLHYQFGKVDVRFSVWRGMLELLHLFSDQRTELKNMWQCGLLLGFMERERVNALLSEMDSAMIMHLSFIVGGCVLLNVKTATSNQILNLEPLDLKRLQAKSLHEYLRDVLIAEKIEYILNASHEWISVDDAKKFCQKPTEANLQNNSTERKITSNVTHTKKIGIHETLHFTPMRVAVVTCKSQRASEELPQEIPSLPSYTNEEFEKNLEKLMFQYGKTRMDVINLLNRKAVTAAAAVVSPVQPPTIGCVQLPSISSTSVSNQLQPIYHHSSPQQAPQVTTSSLGYNSQQLSHQQKNSLNFPVLQQLGIQKGTAALLTPMHRWTDTPFGDSDDVDKLKLSPTTTTLFTVHSTAEQFQPHKTPTTSSDVSFWSNSFSNEFNGNDSKRMMLPASSTAGVHAPSLHSDSV